MIEIERRFLLDRHPAPDAKATLFLQGYLSLDEHTEVRIRKEGDLRKMVIKEGAGRLRRETEMDLSVDQFARLWPATEGRRVEKFRTILPWGRHSIEVDRFVGVHEPLLMAEVEFASLSDSEAFTPPDFFGLEVTEDVEYRNASLAANGIPVPLSPETQIGALPYFFRKGVPHVVLVTNSSQTKWIFPKGQQEPGMSPFDVAAMEAVEEAGAIGTWYPRIHRTAPREKEGFLRLHPLRVGTLLRSWPESITRKRVVLPWEEALERVKDPLVAGIARELLGNLTA